MNEYKQKKNYIKQFCKNQNLIIKLKIYITNFYKLNELYLLFCFINL